MDAICTVITDASWDPTTKVAGWAGRVICQGKRHQFSGQMRDLVDSSNDAEIMAVVNTIYHAMREPGAVCAFAGWLIQSDNLHTIRLLNHHFQDRSNRSWPRSPPRTSEAQTDAIAVLKGMVDKHKPKFVYCRHVKGHVKVKHREARHHVQSDMDHLAKKARKGPRDA